MGYSYTILRNFILDFDKKYMNCVANVNGMQELQTHTCICLVVRSCPTLCSSVDHSPPGSSVHEILPGKNTGVGCHALPQGIFPTQGSDPSLSLAGGFFIVWATGKPIYIIKSKSNIFMYFNNFLLPSSQICIYNFVSMCVYICMYMNVCMYVCMCVCVCIYIYIYIYICISNRRT